MTEKDEGPPTLPLPSLWRLLVAAIAVAGFHGGLRPLAAVGGQRPADVVGLPEASLVVAPHVALVRACIDQFTGHGASSSPDRIPSARPCSTAEIGVPCMVPQSQGPIS
ncbi:MAG TPA: hypothetical protein PLF78_15765 [Caulobacter sp.]|nr:hypothetical protein [Caulobacter sp.]